MPSFRTPLEIVMLLIIIFSMVFTMGCTEKGKNPDTINGWKDLSKCQKFLDEDTPQDFKYLSNTSHSSSLPDIGNTMIFKIGLDTAPTVNERLALVEYVEKGGTLVLASDNAASAGELASRFGIFYYDHMVQDSEYDFNTSFIISTTNYFTEEMNIMFNQPLALNMTEDSQLETHRILATSPIWVVRPPGDRPYIASKSFVDLNDNGVMDGIGKDLHGPVALAYKVKKGDGTAYIFGNTGPFLDSIFTRRDNRELVTALIEESLGEDGKIYFDINHLTSSRSNHIVYPA